jgi:hypothetical protein
MLLSLKLQRSSSHQKYILDKTRQLWNNSSKECILKQLSKKWTSGIQRLSCRTEGILQLKQQFWWHQKCLDIHLQQSRLDLLECIPFDLLDSCHKHLHPKSDSSSKVGSSLSPGRMWTIGTLAPICRPLGKQIHLKQELLWCGSCRGIPPFESNPGLKKNQKKKKTLIRNFEVQ